ncbi:MAG: peptide-methionine (S)-S-oxide reductase MsrA [Tissierellia bacterium]|nr:peptide-methionine (S)-S-oxide reductase MsrA [Tissierellia bacterium]
MIKTIYLAGGCFRGVEAYFKTIEGVICTQVGYANGDSEETKYEQLKFTGHAETVKLEFDENIIDLEKILEYFYYIVDPFSINRQANDIGFQYRTGIFTEDEEDFKFCKDFIKQKQSNEKEKIQIKVEKLKNYIKAEEYHQDYLYKNPLGYCHINLNDKPKL